MTKADELAAKLKQRLQGSDETEISTDTAIDHWPTQVNDLYLQIETWLAPLSEAGLGIRRNSTHVYERHPSGATYNYAVDQLLLEALDRTITFDPIARFSPKAEYAIHKPHLPYGRGMKSGIRVGSMLHLSSYPKQSVGYLPTALQPFSRQPNRFVLVHQIADETMFMQSAHGLEVEPFPSIAVIKTEGYQQGKHGFFNQFVVVFHDRCSARSLNSP